MPMGNETRSRTASPASSRASTAKSSKGVKDEHQLTATKNLADEHASGERSASTIEPLGAALDGNATDDTKQHPAARLPAMEVVASALHESEEEAQRAAVGGDAAQFFEPPAPMQRQPSNIITPRSHDGIAYSEISPARTLSIAPPSPMRGMRDVNLNKWGGGSPESSQITV